MADRSVVYRLRAEIGQFKAQMAQAGASVKDAADKMTSATKDGEQFRRGLDGIADIGGKVGLAAAAGLAAATKAAVDWESAWAGVQKTTDGTASEMAELEGQLRELARTMPATHQEIAATAEAAGQLGVAREDIADFTETMIQLGATTNLSADEAATSIQQMANVMGTAPDDIDRLGAALVALGNDGASTERDIIQMSQRIAGAGAQIGLTEPQILAIANATASMGIEAEAGGSAISTAFTKMAMAVSSGGPKLEKFAEIAGTSTAEFQRMFRETPAEAFAAFTQGLDRINKSGGDVFGTLKEIGLSDIRVSQAMLGMASAGDLLTDSLKTGDEAWKQNSALAEEFAKRADTTAAEVQVAWNNIKDAGIELGSTLLPVLSSAASTVTTLTDAFQSLPGPVQNAATGVLGITAVFGGGLWFTAKTIGGIASMRQSLSDLGVTASGTRTRLLALNGVKFVALAAALTAVEQGMEKAFSTRIDAADLERNLQALGNGQVSDDLKRLGDDIQIVTSQTNKAAEPIREFAQGLFTLGQATDTPMDKAAANIEQLDQALATMVESGNIGEARSTFAELLEIVRQGGGSQMDAIDQFDAFNTAIANAGAASEELAPTITDSTGAIIEMGDAASGATPLTEDMAKALADAREGAYESASSFVNLGDSLNDSKVSLGDWIAELEANARALREFERNAEKAGKKGLDEGLIQSLQEAGEEGALRLEQLAGASEKEIARANRAWRKGQRASDEYADSVEDLLRQILGLPPRTDVDVKVDTGNSLGLIGNVKAALDALKDKKVTITTIRQMQGLNKAADVMDGRAMGGLVTGPGGPTDDLIPTWLSNREYVIRASAVEKYGVGFFDAVNAERLATGGQPGRKDGKSKGTNFLGFFPEVGLGLNAFIKSLEASKDALDDELSARKSVAEALASSVTGKFTSDLFGNTNIWSAGGSLADAIATLQGDIAGSQAFQSDIASLQALGLSGAALDSLLTQADPETVANIAATASAESVAEFQRLFQQRIEVNAATVTAAQMATGVAQEIATLGAKVDQTNAHLATLTGIQSDIQKTGPSKTGKAVGKTNNKGASKAQLNRLRG